LKSFRVSTCRRGTSKAGSTKEKVCTFVFVFVLVFKSPNNVKYFTAYIGGKGLGSLRNLETLDLGVNFYDTSVLPYLNEAVSLKTLILHDNLFKGGFPVQELINLTSLEVLDLKFNKFSGQLPTQGIFNYDPALTLIKSMRR
jgi:hypothetical protein